MINYLLMACLYFIIAMINAICTAVFLSDEEYVRGTLHLILTCVLMFLCVGNIMVVHEMAQYNYNITINGDTYNVNDFTVSGEAIVVTKDNITVVGDLKRDKIKIEKKCDDE